MFEQLLRQLWRGVLLEAALGDSVAGAAAARPWPAPKGHKTATREEAAVQRWLQALQVRPPRPASCARCSHAHATARTGAGHRGTCCRWCKGLHCPKDSNSTPAAGSRGGANGQPCTCQHGGHSRQGMQLVSRHGCDEALCMLRGAEPGLSTCSLLREHTAWLCTRHRQHVHSSGRHVQHGT